MVERVIDGCRRELNEKEGTTESRRKEEEEGASLPGRKVPRRFENLETGQERRRMR